MNLRVTRIGEQRAAFVGPPDGCGIGPFGICRKVIYVSVAACRRAPPHRPDVRFDLAGDQIAGHDAARTSVDHDQVEHLGARIHGDAAGFHLALQGLIGAQQKLLARSGRARKTFAKPARRRTIGWQAAAILTRERHALGHALVDDLNADLRQPVNVGFARPEVAALYRVVKQAVDAVAVVLIILGGIDAALRGNGMRAARRILKAEAATL